MGALGAPARVVILASTPVVAAIVLSAIRPAAAEPPGHPPTTGSASSIEQAGTVPEQVVWLKSGGVIRGRIVELVPEERVVLELATGELRSIAWQDISRTTWIRTVPLGSQAPSPPASATAPATPTRPASPTPPASAAPASPPRASAPGIVLHLQADRDDLWVEARRRFQQEPWQRICVAPCGSRMDLRHRSLRVNGPDVRPSNPFFVHEASGEETLHARSGSMSMHLWGQRSLVGGIALALLGGLAYGLGQVQDSDVAVTGGLVTMAIGGTGILVALPLLGSSRTSVFNSEGERVGAAAGQPRAW